jgi:peptide deformylase
MSVSLPDLSLPDLRIVHYPAPVLRQKAEPIDDPAHAAGLAVRMIELMREAEGIGLAAPQIGLPIRMFVVEVPPFDSETLEPPEHTDGPRVYINPVLSEPGRGIEPYSEGCLSLPDITGDVLRPTEVTITAYDATGSQFTERAGGLLARCWQHENDHLDGVLILDRMIAPHKRRNKGLIRDLEAKATV